MTTKIKKVKSDPGGSRGEEGCREAQEFLERGTTGHSHYEGENEKNGEGQYQRNGKEGR